MGKPEGCSMITNINLNNLIYPYFVIAGKNKRQEIKFFPGVFRFSLDRLVKDIAQVRRLGVNKVLLFGVAEKKDALASAAFQKDNLVAAAVKAIKREFPDLEVFTDICLCAYTLHGHCGIIKARTENREPRTVTIDSEKTLEALARIAVSHAEAGADWVAPSAMAKKQVLAIRKALDLAGWNKTKILGYSAKFASNFYGPFRNAADSSPRFGDRRQYQLDYKDALAALREIEDDINEGADMVMVKPALSYLDLIREAKHKFNKPLAAYNVSGEYAFVKYGARQGLWDEKKMVEEIIYSIKRAGADFIISYHAKDIAGWQKENQ
ncbi:MAG: porphobilinogen synthase [Candidatus Omnitrophota bacterium]|nr:porphobilinogen synthase [Candidatus Omnitrophota bacterium]